MKQKQWVVIAAGAACLIAAPYLTGLADEGHGAMKRGQMQGGHDQGEQEEHAGHYVRHLLKHAKEIGLTSEQVGKLKTLQLDFGRSQARAEADVKIARLELHALVDDEQPNLTGIQAKIDQLKKAEGTLLFSALKSRLDAAALLTPEQKEKDRAHREQMKRTGEGEHRGGMGGMGRGGMGGGQGGGGGGQGGGESGGGQQHQH
jgi:Spy/CpxP family protein refolding chaperone